MGVGGSTQHDATWRESLLQWSAARRATLTPAPLFALCVGYCPLGERRERNRSTTEEVNEDT
jgi:hypothetical protein